MTTNTKTLKDNLKVLNKSASRNTDVVISIKNDLLEVRTVEVSFTQYISRDNTNEIKAVELKLSDFKKAANIIKTISTDIDIDIINGYLIIGDSKIKVRVSDYREENIAGEKITLPANYITDALAKCIFYSDKTLRPIYKGILFDFQKDKLILASTDGAVLNKETTTIKSDIEKKITLSTEAIKSLLELKKQRKELQATRYTQGATFSIVVHDLCVEFIYKNSNYNTFTFKSMIKEGKYPDIDAIIPRFKQNGTIAITFSKKEAVECIKQLSFICKESKYRQFIYLKTKNNKLSFYAFSDNSKMKLDIDCTYDCKEGTVICYEYKHLLSILSIIDRSDTIELNCTITEEKETYSMCYIEFINAVYLIMPVNVNLHSSDSHSNSSIKKEMYKLDNGIDDIIDNTDTKDSTYTKDYSDIEDTKDEEPTISNKYVCDSDKAMRLYASDKEDKKHSKREGNKYLKGYCFENKNGKLCQVGKFFYKAGYFVETVKRLGFDIERVAIINSKLLAS